MGWRLAGIYCSGLKQRVFWVESASESSGIVETAAIGGGGRVGGEGWSEREWTEQRQRSDRAEKVKRTLAGWSTVGWGSVERRSACMNGGANEERARAGGGEPTEAVVVGGRRCRV